MKVVEHILEVVLGALGTLCLFIISMLWKKLDTQEARMNGFEKNYIDRFTEIKDIVNRLEVNLKDEISRTRHQLVQGQQKMMLEMVQNYVHKDNCAHNE